MLALVLAAAVSSAPPTPSEKPRTGKNLLRDAGLAAAASAAVALGKPDIRRAIARDGRLSNVLENFAHPIAQVRAGTRRDVDPFWINNVAHPASFAAEAIYLKRRGYSDRDAFLFTQAHSLLWEFAVEGCAFEPSGKDLIADAAGAAAAIWVIHPLTARWPKKAPLRLSVMPARGGLQVSVRF